MGIFDIFSTSDQQNAANLEQQYLTQGYNQLSDLFGQGRTALQQYGAAGLTGAQQQYGAGQQALTQNYGAALAPLQQQYGTTQAGNAQLSSLLGFGPQGSAGVQSTLSTLPGYQFALNQGAQNVLRNQAAAGPLASGATLNALQQQGQGQANQNYFNYAAQLQPYLGANAAASGAVAGNYTGLGQSLNANQMGLGNLVNANQLTQGTGLNQSYLTQGNAAYGTQAAIGNAQAQAALAGLTQSGNIFGLAGGLAGAALLSDERAKTDIEPVGKTFDGQPISRFRYQGDPTTRIGLMAQDVEQRTPGAVGPMPGGAGLKGVDYKRATDLAAALGRRAQAKGGGGKSRSGRPDYAAMLNARRAA
jgi:hypothetical protein